MTRARSSARFQSLTTSFTGNKAMLKALYRLPYADTYTEVTNDGEPIVLDHYEDLGNCEGFVIAPFSISPNTPLLLIPAQGATIEEKQCVTPTIIGDKKFDISPMTDEYAHDFVRFHEALEAGHFEKLVLARISRQLVDNPNALEMFHYICHNYPRAMVMLFDTPQSGIWLMASPEILLDKHKSHLHTMALAGTMPHNEGLPQWSEKNKHEQNIVERYIENTITPFSVNIVKDGPHTVTAGQLMHLRTDFRFRIKDSVSIGTLISRLHPTPAVCGMPKDEARDFIISNESIDRRYYSGFAGPLNLNGETHLYVSLRCMNICSDHLNVYAGGGIITESVAQDEWRETEIKLISHV